MEVFVKRPVDIEARPEIERRCYELLDSLDIEYAMVDHPAAMTMEACAGAGQALGIHICKNLFLTNRQQSVFYLLLMPGDKPFKTKYLSAALGVTRLSFAGEEHMTALLGMHPGSVSVLGLMNDLDGRVRLVIDSQVLEEDLFGCHPCNNTSSLAFCTADLVLKVLPAMGHDYTVVELPQNPQ